MDSRRWRYTLDYLTEVFGAEDTTAAALSARAQQQGLRPIALTSDVARLLTLLAKLIGARRAIEIGTLGGYSALHIARGLERDGELITIEADPEAAAHARSNLAEAGLGERVRVESGSALDVLPGLVRELGPGSVDLLFFDADKREYAAYWELLRPLLREGGLLVADNILGTNQWWIDDEDLPIRAAIDRFNRLVATDPGLDAVGVVARQGLVVARRRGTQEGPAR